MNKKTCIISLWQMEAYIHMSKIPQVVGASKKKLCIIQDGKEFIIIIVSGYSEKSMTVTSFYAYNW